MRLWVIAAISMILGVGVFLHTLLYSDSWRLRANARSDLEALVEENESSERDVEQLRMEIEAMRERPSVQERAIRDKLGYTRPSEIVLELGSAR